VNGKIEISVTATSGLPVIFTIATPDICTADGNILTAIVAGVCTVMAEQAGDANYLPAPTIRQDITVAKANQKISGIYFNAENLVINEATRIHATATSGLKVTFSSATPGICAVHKNIVTGIAAGICTVVAHQPGNSNYLAAPRMSKDLLVIEN